MARARTIVPHALVVKRKPRLWLSQDGRTYGVSSPGVAWVPGRRTAMADPFRAEGKQESTACRVGGFYTCGVDSQVHLRIEPRIFQRPAYVKHGRKS